MTYPKCPLDYPPIWRGLVKRLNTVLGLRGPYVEIHDARVIGEFCAAFNVSLDDVSAKLETFCHPVAERWQ
jgi:hypothetical protein